MLALQSMSLRAEYANLECGGKRSATPLCAKGTSEARPRPTGERPEFFTTEDTESHRGYPASVNSVLSVV